MAQRTSQELIARSRELRARLLVNRCKLILAAAEDADEMQEALSKLRKLDTPATRALLAEFEEPAL